MTVYKSIEVGTKAYRKIMKQIGKCMEKGGYVEYDHRVIDTRDLNGHLVQKHLVDVVLHDA